MAVSLLINSQGAPPTGVPHCSVIKSLTPTKIIQIQTFFFFIIIKILNKKTNNVKNEKKPKWITEQLN